jgi:hypothetical protein
MARYGAAWRTTGGGRELPDVEVLAGVRRIFRICGFCATYPSPDRFMVSAFERRIFPANDLSDIALAVTVEPQVWHSLPQHRFLCGNPKSRTVVATKSQALGSTDWSSA